MDNIKRAHKFQQNETASSVSMSSTWKFGQAPSTPSPNPQQDRSNSVTSTRAEQYQFKQ